MRHFRSHADALTQRGGWMDGLTDINSVCTHLNLQSNFANHIARVRADHAAAENVAMAVCLWSVIEQQLGKALQIIN